MAKAWYRIGAESRWTTTTSSPGSSSSPSRCTIAGASAGPDPSADNPVPSSDKVSPDRHGNDQPDGRGDHAGGTRFSDGFLHQTCQSNGGDGKGRRDERDPGAGRWCGLDYQKEEEAAACNRPGEHLGLAAGAADSGNNETQADPGHHDPRNGVKPTVGDLRKELSARGRSTHHWAL